MREKWALHPLFLGDTAGLHSKQVSWPSTTVGFDTNWQINPPPSLGTAASVTWRLLLGAGQTIGMWVIRGGAGGRQMMHMAVTLCVSLEPRGLKVWRKNWPHKQLTSNKSYFALHDDDEHVMSMLFLKLAYLVCWSYLVHEHDVSRYFLSGLVFSSNPEIPNLICLTWLQKLKSIFHRTDF